MRYLISLLLLFAILENVISDDSIKKRMLRVALKLKEIQKRKEMQRKLQDGIEAIEENTAQPVPPVVEPTIPDVPYNDTGNDNPESSDPFGENTELPPNKPFNPPQKGNNKNANIQPVKFHSYSAKKTTDASGNTITTIEFRVYIYIFGIPIPKVIVYRLRITRKSKLRSLDDSGDESLKSECKLSDPNLAGQNATEGKAPNYDCTADSKNDIGDDAQVAINTDVDFAYSKPDGSFEFLGFDQISFNGNSSEEATNLQQSKEEVPDFDVLKNGDIIDDGDRHTLRIQGTQQRGGVFGLGENITMSFENLYKDGEDNVEPYECTINSTNPFILNCDTSSHSIRTSPKSLHLSSGVKNISVTQSRRAEVTVKQKLLMIEMKEPNNTYTYDYYTTGSNAKYRKKSSGLSGGAIAGIVIASVVVLVAASIAAIMLRKPSPPIDNSTVVGLKSTDNI